MTDEEILKLLFNVAIALHHRDTVKGPRSIEELVAGARSDPEPVFETTVCSMLYAAQEAIDSDRYKGR